MDLTPQTIATFRSLVCDTVANGLPFPPFKECFTPCEEVRASHLLYADYLRLIENRPLPKVVFYILLEEMFGHPNGKDGQGNGGYKLACKEAT